MKKKKGGRPEKYMLCSDAKKKNCEKGDRDRHTKKNIQTASKILIYYYYDIFMSMSDDLQKKYGLPFSEK